VKSALTAISNEGSETRDGFWKQIWKLQVPQRMRFFLWLTTHDRLLTNTHRVKRGLVDDPQCKGCLQEDEDRLHILRDCKYAREVWTKLVPADKQGAFFDQPLHNWLKNNLRFSTNSTWSTLFTTAVWWLWKWRNVRCFEDLDFH